MRIAQHVLCALTVSATTGVASMETHAQDKEQGATITVHEIDFYDNNNSATDVRMTSGRLAEHEGVSSIYIWGYLYAAYNFTFEVGPRPLSVTVERVGQGTILGNYWPCFDAACGCVDGGCQEGLGYPLPNSTETYLLQPGLYRYSMNCGQTGAGLRFTWVDSTRGPGGPVAPCCLPGGCADLDEATCASLGGTWIDEEGQTCADCPPYCEGDFNGDGEVDGYDLSVILNAWGFCTEPDP